MTARVAKSVVAARRAADAKASALAGELDTATDVGAGLRRRLGDFIHAHAPSKRPGRPRRPVYERSFAEAAIDAACRAVRRRVKIGASVEDAAADVAAGWRFNGRALDQETIIGAYLSKRGSARSRRRPGPGMRRGSPEQRATARWRRAMSDADGEFGGARDTGALVALLAERDAPMPIGARRMVSDLLRRAAWTPRPR